MRVERTQNAGEHACSLQITAGEHLISAYITDATTMIDLSWLGRLVGYLIAVVLDVGLFIVAFRVLTSRMVSTRQVLPGALLSGLVFWVLQPYSRCPR